METAGACFERCLGQAPAEVLMLRQLEAATRSLSHKLPEGHFKPETGYGFKPQFNNLIITPRLR
ncbi:hypothetical protein [Limnohabitans lacus]|jgi:hypothetical protein|uniref:Uncharacterized protein n=1 Tax=Limnohabitans lacus TaxID=3045173 RepID=A0ABT6X9U4_9BURK|nr:hypothetical protein [Limnohabitans sp. HM2-2]MDI9234891.1 hypothetical protein [Limnohabitans sp. HM2-2]